MLVLRRWLRVLKISPAFLILICSGCLLWLWSLRQDNNHIVLTDFWDDGNVDHYGDDDVLWSDGSIDSYADRSLYRTANESSTFWLTYKKLEQLHSDPGNYDSLVSGLCPSVAWSNDILREEKRFLREWDDENPRVRRLNRCKLLVSGMYQLNENWINSDAVKKREDSYRKLDDAILLTERMRVYNYCFIKGGLNTLDVFKAKYLKENNITAWDFQYRMFPFLRRYFNYEREFMLPKVMEFTSDLDTPVIVHDPLKIRCVSPLEFNVNFLRAFTKISKGKGIVTTMNSKNIALFERQLRVLDKLNNTLPIQVVSVGRELTRDYYTKLSAAVQKSKQHVYLVDLTTILDRTFCRRSIATFSRKWFATLFNTFDEEIFLDVDAVPFKQPADFFDIDLYNKSGMYLYRDRNWGGHHKTFCADFMLNLRPTYEEKRLLGTKLFLETHEIFEDSELDLGTDASVKIYNNFFNEHFKHHIDSGLMVINKSRKLIGLAHGLMLNLATAFDGCIHGDKEYFWFGQHFMGELYSVDPYAGSLAGPLEETYDENKRTTVYKVCGGQIAHCDSDNELSWVNGGLTLCKYLDRAERDFKKISKGKFFLDIETVEELDNFYNKPWSYEAFMIPIRKRWHLYPGCISHMFCGTYEDPDDGSFQPYEGTYIKFSEDDLQRHNELANVWAAYERDGYVSSLGYLVYTGNCRIGAWYLFFLFFWERC